MLARWTVAIAIAVGAVVILLYSTSRAQSSALDQMIFVSEAFAGDRSDGCGAISVLDTSNPNTVVFRGISKPSLWRLAASDDLAVVIASAGAGNKSYMYRLRQDLATGGWRADTVKNLANFFVTAGGVAIVDDGRALVASVGTYVRHEPGIARIRMPANDNAIVTLDDIDASDPLGHDVTMQILRSPDGEELISVTDKGKVFTHHLSDLSRSRVPLAVPTVSFDPARPPASGSEYVRATLSPGGRYLILAQGEAPSLVVVDRTAQRVSTIDVSNWLTMTGGVAFNAGWQNRGLLAVHGGGRVMVFNFVPDNDLEALASISIDGPPWPVDRSRAGSGPVAWSGDGSRLIAGVSSDADDFAIFNVSECGRHIELDRQIAVCPSHRNFPADIVTANGHIPTPEGFVSQCPTPSWSDDYVPGPHQTATASPTAPPFLPYVIVMPTLLTE